MADTEPLRLSLAGWQVEVEVADPVLRGQVARALRHCPAGRRAENGGPSVARFFVPADGPDAFALYRDGAPVCEGLPAPDLVARLVYEVTLALAGQAGSTLVLHAAGLARAGRGIVLCGGSGAGKSTLAVHLVAAGFDFLSDELIALGPAGAVMHGFPRPLALKFGADDGYARRLETLVGGTCGQIDPAQLRPGCVVGEARPVLLVFPCFQPGTTAALAPLSPAAAAFRLLPRLVNRLRLGDAALPLLAQVCGALPAYAAPYGEAADLLPLLVRAMDGER